jgi:DNA-binding winged helix-turn-helix (wHTH) protein
LKEGREVPLIPRYFDLLALLLARRDQAVTRREILDAVWSDVVVSDGALSQAVRSLRRALGDDDPREPVFIRTHSRHGYRFVFAEVREEEDEGPPAAVTAAAAAAGPAPAAGGPDVLEEALGRLLSPPAAGSREEAEAARREAAEALHALGTEDALRRLDRRPGHERGRAMLRDARWDVPGAGEVPLLGAPGALRAVWHLVTLRLRRALRLAGRRWTAACGGGAIAGLVAGLLGGLTLAWAPGSRAGTDGVAAVALVGVVVGGLGAAGVGAGLAMAEALARSSRGTALVALGSLGGGVVGALSHMVGRRALQGLFGQELAVVGGGWEGLALGAAAGLGLALTTHPEGGGMATPRGKGRVRTVLATAACCGLAALLLTWAGRPLAAVSLNAMARGFKGSRVGLAPLARLVGEAELGPLSRSLVGAYEGLLFGLGLAWGLTRRPADT